MIGFPRAVEREPPHAKRSRDTLPKPMSAFHSLTRISLRQSYRALRADPRLWFVYQKAKLVHTLLRPTNAVLRYRGVRCSFALFDASAPPVIQLLMAWRMYERETVRAMEEYLPEGGTCFDIGASSGYFSAIAAGCVGPRGSVHACDPLSESIAALRACAAQNPSRTFTISECAIGETSGTAQFSVAHPYRALSSLEPALIPEHHTSIPVRVRRFDDYCLEHAITSIDVVKIDVEGHEFSVLRSMDGWLAVVPRRPVILCEIQPRVYRTGTPSLDDLERWRDQWGYDVRDIRHRRPVRLSSLTDAANVLLLPRSL